MTRPDQLVNNLKVDFADFRPTQAVANHVREVANRIFMGAPSDSTTLTQIRRIVDGTGEVFEGIFRITSSVGTFFVRERDHDVIRLAERLKTNIENQLSRWKLDRFAEE